MVLLVQGEQGGRSAHGPYATLAGQAACRVKRDQVTILTKTHASTEAEMSADLALSPGDRHRLPRVSGHTLDALRTAAQTDWVDVDLARLNPAPVAMDADPATVISVLRTMKQKGKGVIGMKILGAGQLRGRQP